MIMRRQNQAISIAMKSILSAAMLDEEVERLTFDVRGGLRVCARRPLDGGVRPDLSKGQLERIACARLGIAKPLIKLVCLSAVDA
jgi:hypothetical protein